MKTVETSAIIGPDGRVNVSVPLDPHDAGRQVRITIEPLTARSRMTQEEWAAFVDRTAGSIDDPTFQRPPQPDFEERDPVE